MSQNSLETLFAIEAIKKLKYTYLRAVDTHDWALLESTLTEDCSARYDGGKYSFDDRKQLVSGLKGHMDSPQVLTMHNCHHPEIDIIDGSTASGKWYLQDLVFNKEQNWMLFGTAIYTDHYRYSEGEWRICHTEYERIMETINAPIPSTLSFTHNMFEKNKASNFTMSNISSRLDACTAQLCQTGAPFEILQDGDNAFRLYKNAPSNMRELIDVGRNHGDQEFLVYQQERMSFKQFFEKVDALGHHLLNNESLLKGDRIAIAMRNYPEWMIAYTAIISIGAIVVPLNSWGSSDELCYGLEDSGAKYVICDLSRLQLVKPLLSSLDCKAIVAREESRDEQGVQYLEDILAKNSGRPLPMVAINPDDIAQIMYTSGTTGRPKGAVSSHQNICQAMYSFEFHATCSAMANPSAIEKMFAGGFAPCTLLSVPLFHVSGCYAAFLLNLRGGRKTVMMYKWSPAEALKLISAERVTIFSAAPSMVLDLLRHPDFASSDTSSLFSLGGGGSACPPSFKDTIEATLDNAYVGTGYGMTESNAICASCTGEAYFYKSSSAGTLSPLVEWQTRDENGQVLAKNETGEIWLKSICNIQHYWNKPDADKATFDGKWMATGDIGYLDEENFVYLVDRAKDLIIRGGENIYPAEIEACLSLHPSVAEAVIIAVPDERLGETPGAVIRVRANSEINATEINAYLSDKLAAYKIPSQVWIRTDEMPRNAAGKVLKSELKRQYIR